MKKWIVSVSEMTSVTRTIEAKTAQEAVDSLLEQINEGEVMFEDYGDREVQWELEK